MIYMYVFVFFVVFLVVRAVTCTTREESIMTLFALLGRSTWSHLLWVCGVSVTLLIAQPRHGHAAPPWDASVRKSEPQDLEIQLITFGPGTEVPSWFGHTAIAVVDRGTGQRRAYNFGMFTFDSTFVGKFVLGRLDFWVGSTSYGRMLKFYAAMDRDVRVMTLNLSPEKAQELAEFLSNHVRPKNREYLYHHYDDNCATRIRDAVDRATGGQLKLQAKATPARMSIRDHTRRHTLYSVLDYGMMFALNNSVDRPITAWEEMFLPEELERHVRALEYVNTDGEKIPLVRREEVIYVSKARTPTPKAPRVLWPLFLLMGIMLGALNLILVRRYVAVPESRGRRILLGLYQVFVLGVFGSAGVLLALMWLVTNHMMAHHNENLLLSSPWLLLGVFAAVGLMRGRVTSLRTLKVIWLVSSLFVVLGLAIKLTPWGTQDNLRTLMLCVPLHMGMVYSMHVAHKLMRSI